MDMGKLLHRKTRIGYGQYAPAPIAFLKRYAMFWAGI
jgi:hypothetical protein